MAVLISQLVTNSNTRTILLIILIEFKTNSKYICHKVFNEMSIHMLTNSKRSLKLLMQMSIN